MRQDLDMRITVLLLLASVSAARAGVLVASTDDKGSLFVDQVAADKVTKIYDEAGQGAVAYAFSDPRTLWVVRRDKAGFSIGKVVDGKAAPSQALDKLKLAKAGDDLPSGYEQLPRLVTTKHGEVYVATCTGLDNVDHGDRLMHCAIAYRRVDDGSNQDTTKRPKDIAFEFGVTAAPKLPAIKKPPAGFTTQIVKTKLDNETLVGFTCTATSGKHWEWPEAALTAQVKACGGKAETDACNIAYDRIRFTPKVTKVEWISASPAIVRIEAKVTTPVDEKLHEEHVVAECADELTEVRPLRDGLVLTDGKVRKPTGEVVGSLRGQTAVVAP
jgi:hypothetical protein